MSSTMTKSKTSKQISCKVRMLDDQELPFYIDPKATGQDLFTIICNFIDLLESDYFGLEYVDSHRNTCWVEMDKPVLKQVTETKFSLCVKFYTPDPGQLEEELTRYLFALQIKRDLSQGTLLCSDNTAALLASYVAQAEIGDYLESYNNNPSYLAGRKFFPHQTNEHEIRIMNFHKNHVGQLPADADLNLLDIARKVELYGIKMHPAKDHEQVNLNLAVAHMGILVFQNITKINTFSWAKIRKLSFKRKKFLIKLQPEGYGYYKDTVEFYFDTRDDCKNFWKKCIEYHAFFRCVTIKRPARSRSRILTRGSSFRYQGRTQKEILEYAREHYSKSRSFTRSYSNTRTVAPSTGRSHRSPASALKTSDTMRSQETNISSNESARHATRSNINPTTIITTDVQPNDVYHHVYHDDSSTHGSRTLDSRFSRDKYDLSDEDDDDEEETNQHKHEDKTQSNEHETEKPVNGSLVTDQPLTDTIPQTIPDDNNNNNNTTTKLVTENETETHFVSKDVIGSSEFDKGKSPGDDEQHINKTISNEEEEEEDYSESNHKIENRVSLEIYHNNQNENKTKDIHDNDSAKRYSASLKMYLNTRHSSGGSHSICIASNILNLRSKHQNESYKENDEENEQQQQPEIPIVRRSHSLELQRTLSEDITHSPSNSSTPSSPLEIPPVERLIGSNKPMETYTNDNRTPPVVIEIRAKPHSLPRMTNYIEYIDRRTLPSVNSLSWQDDTIENDQNMPLNENESPEDLMELARQLIESLVTKIVEEERQFYKTVDRLVEQACSRALNLYLMERRAQLFSGSPRLPHHKSCILKSINTDKDSDNNIHNHNQDVNNLASRLRTKSSPVIRSSTTTTDWTDVSRKLAAQTCFAAYPSGSNLHELNRSDFSTFSEAKLKFFNIVTTDVLPSQSSLSLPAHLPLSTSAPNALSSSSSTRSSRASSVSSYASSMHVPCLPVLDNQLKRHQRPLSARLLDFSDDSDSNPTTSISTSLKTCILPTTTVTTHTTTTAPESPPHTNNPLPPPPLRTQRRLHQQQKRRSSEDLNSSSDDSLSHHLNKAAGFRSVFPQRNNPYK